ncbi:class I SAM-dependent methyltransferase [Bacillus safensis]|uniref:class I SAM-dependent methyltransferase n=1 Tax=Bacillus safensis TaxID=561879 RepID=UPI0020171BDF|nr:class I SAM-dependent methyltransferase [Bacillus safensis]
MKKALYHEDSGLYLEKMRMAFQEHYEQRTDMWSTDPSLTDAAVMSLKAWRSREKNALASVLDIGCGNGRALEHLSGLSAYVGIDLYEHEEWEGLQKRETVPVHFVHQDFMSWSMDQGRGMQFDLILDHGCFHHQHPDDHERYLKQVSSLLHEGGVFSLVVWGEQWKTGLIGEDGRSIFHSQILSLAKKFVHQVLSLYPYHRYKRRLE